MQKITFIITLFLLSFTLNANATSIEEYIDSWKDVAILQMKEHNIPASITLAQGILESGAGNSPLAKNAKNHFGIKCHDWKGKKYYQDDDSKNECFRKYENAMQSYEDHSLFLVNRSRYSFLFDYDVTDYVAWAKGLKKAGYATLPTYADKLIDLIERYQLHQYDKVNELPLIVEVEKEINVDNATKTEITVEVKVEINKEDTIDKTKESSNKLIRTSHQVYSNENKTQYVKAGKHDTFYQIAKEFEVNVNQLRKWNDFPKSKDLLVEGEKIYIMRKKTNISNHLKELDLSTHSEPWMVAQEYGVQLQALLQKNKSVITQYAQN